MSELDLPPESHSFKMPDRPPTDEERYKAANEALKKEEQRRVEKRMPKLNSRKHWRNKVANKYLNPKYFLECWQYLGVAEDFHMPEEEEDAEPEDAPCTDVLHINSDGSRVWLPKERYRDLIYDFTGPISDEDRPVREPRDWLRLKHPEDYEKLLKLERFVDFKMSILDMSDELTKKRFHYILRSRPEKFKDNTIIRLRRLREFRAMTLKIYKEESYKAKRKGQDWSAESE